VDLAAQLRAQLRVLNNQLGSGPKRPRPSPSERVAAGEWPEGGHAVLQEDAVEQAKTVLAACQPLLKMAPANAMVTHAAGEVSLCLASLLCTLLPAPRPKSLYTLQFKGVEGVPPASDDNYCVEKECPQKNHGCPGNVIERLAPNTYVWHTSHHKTSRSTCVPNMHLSTAAGTHSVLLELLELVSPNPNMCNEVPSR